ncbi:MAG: hypothetical protein IJZ68_05530 [Bacteroidaceae bacterium]|nr:hypothetical protein [Bacteroidaceae bacterium]
MTEIELAKIMETEDLTGGVVIYDKKPLVVVAKKIFVPQCNQICSYLFLIDKKSEIRAGIVEDMYDDIHVYIRPEFRGWGYTSLVMKEIIPYWMPQLVSVTSAHDYQDDKIKYLAACAGLTVRDKDYMTGNAAQTLCAEMQKRAQLTLENSEYARALQVAQDNPKALLKCANKVKHPRRLSKDYAVGLLDFVEDFDRTIRVNCAHGEILLPQASFAYIDFRTSDIERIYERLRRLCYTEVFEEDGKLYIELNPYDTVYLPVHDKDSTSLSFVRISDGDIYVSLYTLRDDSYELLQQNIAIHGTDLCINAPAGLVKCDWGDITFAEKDHLDFTFAREITPHDIRNLVDKYQLPIKVL